MNNPKKLLQEQYGSNCIGQVVRIPDPMTIIINVGDDQLRVDDKVQVYYHGEELKDLDGSSLGNYEYIKELFKVIQVEKKYAICQTFTFVESPLATLATSPLLEKKKVPMKLDKQEIMPLEHYDEKIHIGDPVKRP